MRNLCLFMTFASPGCAATMITDPLSNRVGSRMNNDDDLGCMTSTNTFHTTVSDEANMFNAGWTVETVLPGSLLLKTVDLTFQEDVGRVRVQHQR